MLLRIRTTDGLMFLTSSFAHKKSAFVAEGALSEQQSKKPSWLKCGWNIPAKTHFL